MTKRYELFAKAEAYFIGQAFVIPYALGGGGYEASKLEPFTCPFASSACPTSSSRDRSSGDKPYSAAEYSQLEAAWQKERQAALLRAAK